MDTEKLTKDGTEVLVGHGPPLYLRAAGCSVNCVRPVVVFGSVLFLEKGLDSDSRVLVRGLLPTVYQDPRLGFDGPARWTRRSASAASSLSSGTRSGTRRPWARPRRIESRSKIATREKPLRAVVPPPPPPPPRPSASPSLALTKTGMRRRTRTPPRRCRRGCGRGRGAGPSRAPLHSWASTSFGRTARTRRCPPRRLRRRRWVRCSHAPAHAPGAHRMRDFVELRDMLLPTRTPNVLVRTPPPDFAGGSRLGRPTAHPSCFVPLVALSPSVARVASRAPSWDPLSSVWSQCPLSSVSSHGALLSSVFRPRTTTCAPVCFITPS